MSKLIDKNIVWQISNDSGQPVQCIECIFDDGKILTMAIDDYIKTNTWEMNDWEMLEN